MTIQSVLRDTLQEHCPFMHNNCLNAVLDVAEGLRHSQNLTIAAMGRKLSGTAKVKHKIKKVDRCLGNKHLYTELYDLYKGLSSFVFEHIKHLKEQCIVIDLCYLKDDRRVKRTGLYKRYDFAFISRGIYRRQSCRAHQGFFGTSQVSYSLRQKSNYRHGRRISC